MAQYTKWHFVTDLIIEQVRSDGCSQKKKKIRGRSTFLLIEFTDMFFDGNVING